MVSSWLLLTVEDGPKLFMKYNQASSIYYPAISLRLELPMTQTVECTIITSQLRLSGYCHSEQISAPIQSPYVELGKLLPNWTDLTMN